MNQKRSINPILIIICSLTLALMATTLVISWPVFAASPEQNLPPDMVVGAGKSPSGWQSANRSIQGFERQFSIWLRGLSEAQQNLWAWFGQPLESKLPMEPENGNFIGINGAACAYNTFPLALAAATDDDTLYIQRGTWPGRIGLIDKDLTLIAASDNCTTPAIGGVTIDANDDTATQGGVIEVAMNKTVSLSYLTLMDGSASNGGIIFVNPAGTLNIDHCVITDGVADNGGGIFIDVATLNMTDSTVDWNKAYYYGGGLYATFDSVISIENSSVSNNIAEDENGGGFYAYGNGIEIIVSNSSVSNNTADSMGGGFYGWGDGMAITFTASTVMSNTSAYGGGIRIVGDSDAWLLNNTQLSNNHAPTGWAGALLSTNASVTTEDSHIDQNTAGLEGGAMYIGGGSFTAINTSITNNTSGNYGGGIFAGSGASIDVDSSQVSNNETVYWGGGIYVTGASHLDVDNGSQINGNSTSDLGGMGGGIHISGDNAQVTVTASTVMSNSVGNTGGGIFLNGNSSLILFDDSQVSYNQATDIGGGGVAILNGSAEFWGTSVSGNETNGHGGGVWAEDSTLYLANSTINENTAGDVGGGMALYTSTLSMRSAFTGPITLMETEGALRAVGALCDPIQLAANQYCSQFWLNTSSSGNGGALYLRHSDAEIDYTAFMNNKANSGSAAYISLSDLSLNTSRISGNQSRSGSVPTILHVDGGTAGGVQAYLTVTQATIAENIGTALGYTNYTSGALTNSIVWGNSAVGNILTYGTASCNNTQDGSLGGDNISQDPLFMDTSRSKYILAYYSPSVDVCSTGIPFDLNGIVRPQGTTGDMGAFEALGYLLFLSVIAK